MSGYRLSPDEKVIRCFDDSTRALGFDGDVLVVAGRIPNDATSCWLVLVRADGASVVATKHVASGATNGDCNDASTWREELAGRELRPPSFLP